MLDIPEIHIAGRSLKNVIAPAAYNFLPSEKQNRLSSIMDKMTGGFLTLLDTNTISLKGRLGLNENQTRNIFKLTNTIAKNELHKKSSGFKRRDRQSILNTTFVAETELRRILISLEYNDTAGFPMSGGIFDSRKSWDQPNNDGNMLTFMFLPQKPELNEQVEIKGSFLERKKLSNCQTQVYGRGDRIDFTSTYKSDDKQEFSLTETYYYIGEFELEENGTKKIVYCWGHNPSKNLRKVPIKNRAVELGAVLQKSVD